MHALTSLTSSRVDRQTRCLRSWRQLGLQVISFNHPSEIRRLSEIYDDVTFVAVEASAMPHVGRHCVPVFAIAKYVERRCDVALVVNSDIELRLTPKQLAGMSARAMEGQLVCFWRHEFIDDPTKTFYLACGFDAFLIRGKDCSLLSPSWLPLGMPYWETWLLDVFMRDSRQIASVESCAALHQLHQPRHGVREAIVLAPEFMRVCRGRAGSFDEAQELYVQVLREAFLVRQPIDANGRPRCQAKTAPIVVDGRHVGIVDLGCPCRALGARCPRNLSTHPMPGSARVRADLAETS